MCVTYIRNICYKHEIIAIFSMHVVKLLKFRVLVWILPSVSMRKSHQCLSVKLSRDGVSVWRKHLITHSLPSVPVKLWVWLVREVPTVGFQASTECKQTWARQICLYPIWNMCGLAYLMLSPRARNSWTWFVHSRLCVGTWDRGPEYSSSESRERSVCFSWKRSQVVGSTGLAPHFFRNFDPSIPDHVLVQECFWNLCLTSAAKSAPKGAFLEATPWAAFFSMALPICKTGRPV